MVRWLREVLVDGPAWLGWRWMLAVRLASVVVAGWLLMLLMEEPYWVALLLAVPGVAALDVAGWVWQWRIRRQQAVRRG